MNRHPGSYPSPAEGRRDSAAAQAVLFPLLLSSMLSLALTWYTLRVQNAHDTEKRGVALLSQ
jgi:hypothetical protein